MLGFIYGNFKDTEHNLEKVSRLAPCDGTSKVTGGNIVLTSGCLPGRS